MMLTFRVRACPTRQQHAQFARYREHAARKAHRKAGLSRPHRHGNLCGLPHKFFLTVWLFCALRSAACC